jgi:basic membrane protein A and related proteins
MKLRSSFLVATLVLSAAVFSPTPASASTNVCIAYDTGGLGDRSFNDATLAGVKKAQNQMTFTFEGVVTDGTAADRVKRLRTLAAKNCAAIIAVGGEYRKAVDQLSTEFPNIQFSIIGDASIPALNVTSIVFADVQGAFLAGFSAALTSKTGRVGMITTPSSADTYQNGFLAGVTASKKKVRAFVNYTATDLDIAATALIRVGVDVIYTATSGSADEAFSAIVKANTAKNRKKNASDIFLILSEPDLYLTVTPTTAKYLIASVVKRVDSAIADVIGAAVNNSQISDVLDAEAGIYGRRYTIADKGIEIVLRSKALGTQAAAINAAAVAAYAR